MILAILLILIIICPIIWLWINGIEYMHKNHPDYKGDDLFGIFNYDDKNQIE